jgi:hypothetical protein
MIKLAIIGSRDFGDYKLLCETLSPYLPKINLVVSGGARGADKLGERWAKENNIQTLIFYANWDKHGKAAGFIRNEDIIKNCDCVIAFWDGKSKGTSHSLSLAKKFGKPTKIINFTL